MRYYFFTIVISTFLFSCKKEDLPVNVSGNIIFSLTGKIDGETKTFIAGENDFYMHTEYIHAQEIYVLSGELKNGKEGIRIRFFNLPGSTFRATNKTFNLLNFNDMIESVEVDSSTVSASPDATRTWYVNGLSFNQIDLGSMFKLPGKYEVCMELSSGGTCNKKICNDYMLGMGSKYDINFNYKHIAPNTVELIPVINSSDKVVEIKWRKNGEIISQSSLTQYYISPEEVTTFEMEVTFDDGVVLRCAKNVRNNTSSACYFEGISLNTRPDFIGLNCVIIDYTDETGKQYTSLNVNQNEEALLKVTRQEYYLRNIQGNNVLNLSLNFNALLQSVYSEEQKLLKNFKGQFGIAVP